MDLISNIIKQDNFVFIMIIINLILLIGLCTIFFKISKLNKRYKTFLEKLGNGKNIEEDLETFMYRVEKVETQNAEIKNYLQILDEDITKCIQKVGIVRYNAFQDTGSDLSFALALLDEHNNGVLLNGIYSREMSNIYAKPIKNGESAYTMSEEEKQALQQAISYENNIRIEK